MKPPGSSSVPPDSDFGGNSSADKMPRQTDSQRRRALAHVVLHEAMRRHGIPSDWIVGHILFVQNARGRERLIVQFVVQKGDDQLVGHVQRFQADFLRELQRQDPRARDWLEAVCWEFSGTRDPRWATLPAPSFWTEAAAA
ncbi:MAG TPA: hypothetical protein VHA82_03265 [Ramlibacter sp.]|uniref:hypothetical protein n=1 Tax=Ramlibacter sp. TaxID=1917967 RepID=UPI002BC2DA5C|nr:hypothetical protein [Ramlibacter sp.]HVZ42806.1 hypothetical protein [Ramlibacter sp.]